MNNQVNVINQGTVQQQPKKQEIVVSYKIGDNEIKLSKSIILFLIIQQYSLFSYLKI